MKLSEIHEFLARLEVRPTKSLGQNFLHDQNLARSIVAQLELAPNDHFVEIGPGLGALTEYALEQCGSATLIEKDGRLAAFLSERFAGKKVEVVCADAVKFEVRKLFARQPVKVVGNLPYYISSQILFAFTDEPSPAARLVFTLQRELAERLSAAPRSKDYGALTLIIQRRWRVKYVRTLPGSVFFPEPKVESAVVQLEPRASDELPDCHGANFNALVKQGFSQRRKQLRKMLSIEVDDWPPIVARIGISETARAEELSLEQWIALTNLLDRSPTASPQDSHGEKFDIVDAADQVVGTASRFTAHTENLWHRAVHIFVFNHAGELFLQKRSRWKDAHPAKWDSSAAGHVNSGESYDQTAPRELTEELGVNAPVELLGKISASENTGWEFIQIYRAQHDGPFNWPRAEIECGSFFPLDLIREWMARRPEDFATGFIECFSWFEKKN